MTTIQIRERHQLLDNFVLSPAIESYLDLFMYMLAVATNNERLYKSIRGLTSPKPSAHELSVPSNHPPIYIASKIHLQNQSYGILQCYLYNKPSILVNGRRLQT